MHRTILSVVFFSTITQKHDRQIWLKFLGKVRLGQT